MDVLHRPVLDWYAARARDLPWRRPGTSPWSVLVSEVMLQQTPVARVLPVHEAWLERWPTPTALAAEPAGEAVRMWGRLGYPRRALRLHAAARAIDGVHAGVVPSTYEELVGLPGVGDYTASAVAVFAHGRRHPVLDTNVRRVLTRILRARELPDEGAPRRHERRDALALLPDDDDTAATWSVAVMELGALVCTARAPRCAECPVAELCAWRSAGYPPWDGPPRRGQAWHGTDRQCRGRILAVVRESEGPVHVSRLESASVDPEQRERCIAGLLADGLMVAAGPSTYTLP